MGTPLKKPLTAKQTAFIRAKASNPTMPHYKAAMIATGTTSVGSAEVQAARWLGNARLREALDEALHKQGYSVDAAAAELVKAATTATKSYAADGELYQSQIPDYSIRITAIRTIFNFVGDKDESASGTNITFNTTQNYIKNS